MRGMSCRVSSRKLWFTSAVGAFAALALAGTAWSGSKNGNGNNGIPPSEIRNDETFFQANAVALPAGSAALVSFDISWVDPALRSYYLADRNNKSVDVVSTLTFTASLFNKASAGGTGPTFVGTRGTLQPGGVDTGVLCGGNGPFVAPCVSNNNVSGPDGVLTAENSTQLWVGDGNSRVWALNPTTGAMLTPPAGGSNPVLTSPASQNNLNRADELCYDPVDHLVMAANNADSPPFATIISATSFKVVAKITFDGTNGAPNSTNGIEQCAWSPRTGMFTITVPGIDATGTMGVVAQISPKTHKVVKVFGPYSINDCAQPQGQAVGPAPQILLGCNQPSPDGSFNTIIIDENNGSVIQTLVGEGGNDEVWFGEDNGTPKSNDGHYFLARGQAPTAQFLGIVDSQFRAQDQSIQTGTPGGTARRAHSVAADYTSGLVYVPIPATGGGSGGSLGFQSALCGSTAALQAAGCIAVFAPTLPDDQPPPVVVGKNNNGKHNKHKEARERGDDDSQE